MARPLQRLVLVLAGIFLAIVGLLAWNRYATTHPHTIYAESHDPMTQMTQYTQNGRYDEAIQLGLQSRHNDSSDEGLYQQIATIYLIRADKDPGQRQQWVGQAVTYTEKAVSLISKPQDAAGVQLLEAGRSFEAAGDLSTSSRCAYYQRARELLEERIPLLQGDQVQAGGRTFPLSPMRNENEKLLAELKTKAANAVCRG